MDLVMIETGLIGSLVVSRYKWASRAIFLKDLESCGQSGVLT